MQLTYDHQQILSCVQAARRAAAGSTTLPILTHLHIEANDKGLRVSGTDLETWVEASIPLVADKHGACCVPARYFEEYLEAMPGKGETTFQINKKGRLAVSVADGKGAKCAMKFNTLPSKEYPAPPRFGDGDTTTFELSFAEWTELCRRAWFCPGRDDARAVLTNALLESRGDILVGATTNSQRLAMLKMPRKMPQFTALIPPDAVKLVTALLPENAAVNITIGSYQSNPLLRAQLPGITIWSRLYSGTYPAVDRVVPAADTAVRFIANREEFLASLKRVAPMARVVLGKVLLTVNGLALTITSAENEIGAASDSITVTDSRDWTAAFDARFLIDAASASDGEFITFAQDREDRPALISDYNARWAAVIMPIMAA